MCSGASTVLQACATSGNSVQKIFPTTTHWFHSLVLTLILHKSHTGRHCGRVSLVSRHSQPYFRQPPSPHPLLLCAAPSNPQWNVPCPETSPLLSSLLCVCVCVNVFIQRSFCLFLHHLLPSHKAYDHGYQTLV